MKSSRQPKSVTVRCCRIDKVGPTDADGACLKACAGWNGTWLRASTGFFNNDDDVPRLRDGLVAVRG